MVNVVGAMALCRRCLRRPSRALPAPEVQAWATGWPGGQGKRSVTFRLWESASAMQFSLPGRCTKETVSDCNKEQGC